MLFYGGFKFFERQAEPSCLDDKLLGFPVEQTGAVGGSPIGGSRDDGTDTRLDFKKAFGRQLSDDFVGGVWIDLTELTEGTDGREAIAGPELPGNHCFSRGECNLLVDSSARLEMDPKWDHRCTITRSTPLRQA